jgi:hypothetical protein
MNSFIIAGLSTEIRTRGVPTLTLGVCFVMRYTTLDLPVSVQSELNRKVDNSFLLDCNRLIAPDGFKSVVTSQFKGADSLTGDPK